MTKGGDAPGKSLQEGSPMYDKADNTPDGRGGMPSEGSAMPETRGGSGKLGAEYHRSFTEGLKSDGKSQSVADALGEIHQNPGGTDLLIGSRPVAGPMWQPGSGAAYNPSVGARPGPVAPRRRIQDPTVRPAAAGGRLGFFGRR